MTQFLLRAPNTPNSKMKTLKVARLLYQPTQEMQFNRHKHFKKCHLKSITQSECVEFNYFNTKDD